MIKWIILFTTIFYFNFSFGDQGLPMPLPNDPGGQLPPPPPPNQPQPPNQPPQPLPQPPQPLPQPPSSGVYTLGVGDLARFKKKEFSFYPPANLNRLTSLSLTGGVNNIVIKEVRIQYVGSLQEYQDLILPGDLRVGNTRAISLDGRAVATIIVRAANSYFWKKAGNFRVDVSSAP